MGHHGEFDLCRCGRARACPELGACCVAWVGLLPVSGVALGFRQMINADEWRQGSEARDHEAVGSGRELGCEEQVVV